MKARLPHFQVTRAAGGSGFPLSNMIRTYFKEFNSRLAEHGPNSFPSPFNFMESFLRFSEYYRLFDSLQEEEFLLDLGGYFDWFTAGKFPEVPRALIDTLPEAIIHEFHVVSPLQDFSLATASSTIRPSPT